MEVFKTKLLQVREIRVNFYSSLIRELNRKPAGPRWICVVHINTILYTFLCSIMYILNCRDDEEEEVEGVFGLSQVSLSMT